jgi:hypothetical protein
LAALAGLARFLLRARHKKEYRPMQWRDLREVLVLLCAFVVVAGLVALGLARM